MHYYKLSNRWRYSPHAGWQMPGAGGTTLAAACLAFLQTSKLTLQQIGSSAFAKIARVGGHYVVQGHSRSLVPIETPHVTSY